MKRVYEKPVYIAQAYVTASSIAAGCEAKPGSDEGKTNALGLTWGMQICADDSGHTLGKNGSIIGDNQDKYWVNYANKDNSANLFDTTNFVCDFVWSGSNVSGWTTSEGGTELQSDATQRKTGWLMQIGADFMGFFGGVGNGANNKNHTPGYNGKALMYS